MILGMGMIFGILEANDGSIWFGTDKGVYRYDGNTFTDFKGNTQMNPVGLMDLKKVN
jgi:ligand-binding sensor domain-containing protein